MGKKTSIKTSPSLETRALVIALRDFSKTLFCADPESIKHALTFLLSVIPVNSIRLFKNTLVSENIIEANALLHVSSSQSTPSKTTPSQTKLEFSRIPSPWRLALSNGEAVYTTARGAEPKIQSFLERRGLTSLAWLPIKIKDQGYGFLSFEIYDKAHVWTDDEKWLMLSVSELLSLHFEQRKREKMKDEFISIVSHELRAPLAIIKEGINSLKMGLVGKLLDPQMEIVKICYAHASRMARMFNELLNLTRFEKEKEKLTYAAFDLISLVERMIKEFSADASDPKPIITFLPPEHVPPAYGSKDLIAQVFTNLLSNAMRYCKSSIEIKITPQDNTLKISIKDDGVGIDPHTLPTLFERFNHVTSHAGRTEYKGVGLGLAICKEILDLHTQNIWVESTPSQGSTFHFTLPLASKDAQLPKAA